MPALHLLDRSRRGERVELGRKAVVIGGGDTAMDATRTAQRFTGQPATIVYRRTRHEMPAAEEEVEGALEEGNILLELATPLRVLREAGVVVGLECICNRLSDPGPDGRRTPEEIPGSEFVIETDTVIVAVGQLPELTFMEDSAVNRHKGGGITVDPLTGAAGPVGVYAGGDVVIKPSSIIDACADGRRAAEAICRQFDIEFEQSPFEPPALSEDDILNVKQMRARKEPQRKPAMIPLVERFDLGVIESTFTDAEAKAEAMRCVQCTAICDKCVEVCPNRANFTFLMQPVHWKLPDLVCQDDGILVAGSRTFDVVQTRQILHVDDWCNECDDCQTFCVHQGKPYFDKPRLFLTEADYLLETDNAFHMDGNTIRRREGGQDLALTVESDELLYEDEYVRLRLTPEFGVKETSLKAAFEGTLSLQPAAEMAVVLHGIRGSLPFLLV